MMADTGAERTLMRPDVVLAKYLPEATQWLCGVTGHCTELRGPVEMRLGVGGSKEVLLVYVADMKDPCLLGLDYLTQSKACVNLGRRTLRVRREEMPLLPGGAPTEIVAAKRVRLARGRKLECLVR